MSHQIIFWNIYIYIHTYKVCIIHILYICWTIPIRGKMLSWMAEWKQTVHSENVVKDKPQMDH